MIESTEFLIDGLIWAFLLELLFRWGNFRLEIFFFHLCFSLLSLWTDFWIRELESLLVLLYDSGVEIFLSMKNFIFILWILLILLFLRLNFCELGFFLGVFP